MDIFFDCILFIKQFDFYLTCAINSINYHLFKPTIKINANNSPYINIKNIRHPLIELIQEKEPYIPNDINLIQNV